MSKLWLDFPFAFPGRELGLFSLKHKKELGKCKCEAAPSSAFPPCGSNVVLAGVLKSLDIA